MNAPVRQIAREAPLHIVICSHWLIPLSASLYCSGVTSVNHLGITVTDLDTSVAFYCEVVGFSLGLRTEAPASGSTR